MGWPLGSICAQAAHAAVAAVWTYKDHPDTVWAGGPVGGWGRVEDFSRGLRFDYRGTVQLCFFGGCARREERNAVNG